MITCPKHNRWTELQSGAERDCPECPKHTELRHIYGLSVDRIALLTPQEAREWDKEPPMTDETRPNYVTDADVAALTGHVLQFTWTDSDGTHRQDRHPLTEWQARVLLSRIFNAR